MGCVLLDGRRLGLPAKAAAATDADYGIQDDGAPSRMHAPHWTSSFRSQVHDGVQALLQCMEHTALDNVPRRPSVCGWRLYLG